MYFLDVATAIESISSFWAAVSSQMPVDVHISPERTGDTIEDTTGALTGSWIGGVTTSSVGQAGGPYAAAAGMMVRWETGVVLDKHRLRGRTFIVPTVGATFATDGQLATAARNVVIAAAAQFVVEQSASAVIWHRPFKGSAATATRPARPAHVGGHALITASSVPSKGAVLRSRRD